MNYFTELSNYKKKDEIVAEMNNNRRILIVDDEPYNVLGLTIILKQSGYPHIN
jgi:PleD family two-component response regulator